MNRSTRRKKRITGILAVLVVAALATSGCEALLDRVEDDGDEGSDTGVVMEDTGGGNQGSSYRLTHDQVTPAGYSQSASRSYRLKGGVTASAPAQSSSASYQMTSTVTPGAD